MSKSSNNRIKMNYAFACKERILENGVAYTEPSEEFCFVEKKRQKRETSWAERAKLSTTKVVTCIQETPFVSFYYHHTHPVQISLGKKCNFACMYMKNRYYVAKWKISLPLGCNKRNIGNGGNRLDLFRSATRSLPCLFPSL